MAARSLSDPWMLGPLRVPNRVLLAPLAGIGNWFVRLQAKRYGAGMAVSEMVSSQAIHHGNEKTFRELLRIDPRERGGGPVSIQLFGEDPALMRSAAAHVARAVGARDPDGRARRRRAGPQRLRAHGRRGRDAGARGARKPVAVRAAARRARARARARGGPGRARLGDGARRRAPGGDARDPL